MKSEVTALIVLFFFFGCIQVSEKPPQTNGEELPEGTNTPTQDPLEELLEEIEDDLQEETPPLEETPPEEEPVEEEPPPEEEPPVEEDPPPEEPPPLPPPLDPPQSTASVELMVDTKSMELAEEQFVERTGIGSYSGTTFKVFFERAINTGAEFVARFRLENDAGEILFRRTFSAGEEIVFENDEGDKVTYDGLIELQAVYLD